MENTNYFNDRIANINVNNQLAIMLSNFDETYVMHLVDDSLGMRFRPFQLPLPNIVLSFENTLKSIIENVPDGKDQCLEVRESTYKNIIDYICNFYQLSFNSEEEISDYFTLANILYELLVSNFESTMVNVFISFILKEKKNLYDWLMKNPEIQAKNSSSSYNKKIYKNGKLAIIQANIDMVLNVIVTANITFENILEMCIPDKNMIRYILTYISDTQDIFKNHFLLFLNNPATRPDLITEIKLKLHAIAVDEEKYNSIYKEN